MVILKINIARIFTRPAERDPVVSSDAHGPSARFAVQTMEPVPCNVHVLWLRCHFQRLQDTHALPDIFGAAQEHRNRSACLFAISPVTNRRTTRRVRNSTNLREVPDKTTGREIRNIHVLYCAY